MNSVKVNPVSFKGGYVIKGSSELLDEICWYLHRKQGNHDLGFNFMDIRLNNNPFNFKTAQNTDLFLTQEEQELAHLNMNNIVQESLAPSLRSMGLAEQVKVLWANFTKTDNDISKGKPILNLRPEVIQKYFDFLKIPELKPLMAEDVFKGIEQGKFDIVSGRCN